jgi:ribonuclease BN (tRNA processing enzyme)
MSQHDLMNEQKMELILLGTGTCVPRADRNSSGYVVKDKGTIVLLDCGPGILRRMAEAKIDFREIDVICLSHFHPDHVSDLAPFFLATKYTPDFARTRPLTLIGPTGLKEFFHNLSKLYGEWLENLNFPLQLEEFGEDSKEFNSLTIYSKKMEHSKNSIGFRIKNSENKSITYSGDTGFCKEIVELANETDLLLIECSFPDNRKMEEHLTPKEVGEIAKAANVKKVVLTHLYPVFQNQDPVNQVSGIFNGEIIEGRDLLKLYV